ncbi:histidine phosphatase family protein [Piscinibacter sakaiensis]|nr:histidine phosphatase family protein [Piscinibacter sakaiensis]
MTLLLIRHGETALNVARVLQPADTPLSAAGRAQAAALATRLAGAGLAGLVSSDLPRARETAEAVSRACGLPVHWSPLLQERNFGDWRGRAYDTLGADPLHGDASPPGGETAAQFEQRVAAAFALLRVHQAGCGGPLAVVTHGLVIKALLQRHARLAPGLGWPAHGLRNTSLSRIAAEPPHDCDLLDCTRHLDEAAAPAPRGLSGG